MMRSSGSRGTARAGTRCIEGLAVSHGPADAREYEGATSTTSCPSAARSRRKVSIDVETPLTRGKKTSEILRMRMTDARVGANPLLQTRLESCFRLVPRWLRHCLRCECRQTA